MKVLWLQPLHSIVVSVVFYQLPLSRSGNCKVQYWALLSRQPMYYSVAISFSLSITEQPLLYPIYALAIFPLYYIMYIGCHATVCVGFFAKTRNFFIQTRKTVLPLHSQTGNKPTAKRRLKIFWKKFSKNLEGIRKRYYLCTTFASQKAQVKKRDHWNN